MYKKPQLSLAEAIKRADDIEALHAFTERLEDRVHALEVNNTLLAEGLALCLQLLGKK